MPAIEGLIARAARSLSVGHYTPAQIEAAVANLFGVDTTLVDDGTYFVAEHGGTLAGCGGWSRRRTLFGGDHYAARDAALLDPGRDAARIRAFFVDPAVARTGVARLLLRRCEAAAWAAGFRALELMATLPGIPFYRSAGFLAGDAIELFLGEERVAFVPMHKELSDAPSQGG